MPFDLHDTIAALSSPPGPAQRGIVRISGSAIRDALNGLFRPDDPPLWETARLPQRHPGSFWLADIQRWMSVDIFLWPTQRSYTGQPMAEVHTCGSPPLLEAILAAIYAADVRPARGGEFTLRSFLAGKVDLLQAEAVLGVIDADDQVQLNAALQQLAGGISGDINTVREDLLSLLADLEAGLDFVEEDIEFVDNREILARLTLAETRITSLLEQAVDRMRSTGTARVVLAGRPNVGKSTLFNALLGRDAALVSEIAGTTRDYLAAEVNWHGRPIELLDTAGWELQSEGPLQAALALREDQLQRADLIIWCVSADEPPDPLLKEADCGNARSLTVLTKCDLPDTTGPASALRVSAVTGAGLEELTAAVASELSQDSAAPQQLLGTTGARCRDSLHGAVESLQRAREVAELSAGDELLSIEIRVALEELGKVSGAVYTDDILDRIFSKFCIGK
ncbi:tRNA modification GTPase MnmE [Symmachiella macrocystis]|uniref:tRNA modification GTPase MnmE n=1 Tax=Symmachiella macrocystis TaxID=2527985 RepID=A0A5C6BP15_9PLAN|nr:tRNA modification GTPase [Symmachiella macrocystis]TWU13798.1 tRNA modification GTPase MnmE [Symmachiella macrocystis]